jgi:hypothetical protein
MNDPRRTAAEDQLDAHLRDLHESTAELAAARARLAAAEAACAESRQTRRDLRQAFKDACAATDAARKPRGGKHR